MKSSSLAIARVIGTVVALGASPLFAEWRIVTEFDGGNAEVVRLDEAVGVLRIMPALREGRGWPCWWSLRIEGLESGQQVTLEVQAQARPYRGTQVLAAAWSQPRHAWLSADGRNWKPSEPAQFTAEKVAVYRIMAESSQLWLAWGPPFVAADAEALLAGIATRRPEAQRFELARTRGGRAVNGIHIGAENAPNQVWVQARQHAWEAGGSWVGRGFAEWFASEEPAARELRATTCLHFIPIMDVDNVTLGAGGKEAIPRDHNRDWSGEPIHPEVAAAQRMIRTIHDRHGLDVFIDLHNPGANDPVFFYGPFDFDGMSALRQRNFGRWIEIAARHITEPLKLHPRYRVASYVQTAEERSRMSSQWVREHSDENTVAATLETAWNHRTASPEGYGRIGAGLGKALAAYLAERPRRPLGE